MENWLPVVGYEERYEVSDAGHVRSLNFNHTGKTKILKPGDNGCGYLQVRLYKDGKFKHMFVHRLVAEAFLPNPQCLPQVNHRDENKLNNNASNLEWCTASYNNNYGSHNRRMAEAQVNDPKKSKPVQQLDKQGNLLRTFPSTQEAERVTGIAQPSICQCCNGERKSAGGYKWRYA